MKAKKVFSASLLLLLTLSCHSVFAQTNGYLKQGIANYKASNYTGCLQSLAEVIKEDPSNVLAYYYIGMSNIKLGHKDMGKKAYEKVITLNTNPHLSQLAINGLIALGKTKEKEEDFVQKSVKRETEQVEKEIAREKELRTRIATLKESKQQIKTVNPGLDYLYKQNNFALPEPQEKIKQLELNNIRDVYNKETNEEFNKTSNVNGSFEDEKKNLISKAGVPSDKEIADAVKTLAKAGLNPYVGYSTFGMNTSNTNSNINPLQMFAGNTGNINNNSDIMAMLPYLMAAGNKGNTLNGYNTDFVKTMMMSNMVGELNSSLFNSDKNSTY